ncbi:ribosomal RNA-processing protein 8 isoform X2 [Procambarus clarkii]|uniref:ribosomal RNA-processing protein 8 isoform X2 n=1 Tax=Procambarus clarkii TaxID=6728 RepID=UPI003742667C
MSFLIPDWGDGDAFSYHNELDLPGSSALTTEPFKSKSTKLKKKQKNKIKCNQIPLQIPKKIQTNETSNSLNPCDVDLNDSQNDSLLFPRNSSKKRADKKKKNKMKQGLEFKVGEEGNKIFGNSENTVENESTETMTTNGNTNPNIYNNEHLIKRVAEKKKKRNRNKYKEINANQKKEQKFEESNLSSTSNEYATGICAVNGDLSTNATAISEYFVTDDKESHKAKEKVRSKHQASNMNKTSKIRSKNIMRHSNVTEIEIDNQMIPNECNENTLKIENIKLQKSKKNKRIKESKNYVESTKKKIEEKKLSSEIENSIKDNDCNELGSKQKKKKKKNKAKETVKELKFESNDEDCDPNFQSDFETLLKKLDFDNVNVSQPIKRKRMYLNDSSIISRENENINDCNKNSELSEEDNIRSSESEDDNAFEYDRDNLETKKQNKDMKLYDHKHNENAVYEKKKKTIKEQKIIKDKKQVKTDSCETSSPKIYNKGKKFDKGKLAQMLEEAKVTKETKPLELSPAEALKQKMTDQLTAARFRPKEWVVADFGCGEAALALRVPQQKVHSLDLVAVNSRVTACDMAHSPLQSAAVDVVVFCLSLMCTNIKDFILEANRVLKEGGVMKIAEVESRFGDVQEFVNVLKKFGFHCVHKDTNGKYFFLFEFKKNRKLKKTTVLPDIILKPCIYKKR